MLFEPRREDVCGGCSQRPTYIHGRIHWCGRCDGLVVPFPWTPPKCEGWGPDVPCMEQSEFLVMNRGIPQFCCRPHLEGIAESKYGVYGLTDRAIDAVRKWNQPLTPTPGASDE